MPRRTSWQDNETWASQFEIDDWYKEELTNHPAKPAQPKRNRETEAKARLTREAQVAARESRDCKVKEALEVAELAARCRRAAQQAEREELKRETEVEHAKTWFLELKEFEEPQPRTLPTGSARRFYKDPLKSLEKSQTENSRREREKTDLKAPQAHAKR